jgi:hypothetical protein
MKINFKKSNAEGHKKDQSHLMSIFKTHDPNHETEINIIERGKKRSKTLHKKWWGIKLTKKNTIKNKDPKKNR